MAVSIRFKIIWSIEEFKYLNLAMGYRPFLSEFATFVGNDGCIKCFVSHPDMCPLPKFLTLPMTKIPLNIKSAYLVSNIPYPEWLTGTIQRKRGRSDKFWGPVPKWGREYDSTYDINWRTILTDLGSPHTRVLSEFQDKIAFPLVQVPPGDSIQIAYLSMQQFDCLVMRRNGKLTFEELNREIRRIVSPNAIWEYRLIDDPSSGVAFRACTKDELPLYFKDREMVLNDNDMRKAPGILMSCFLQDKSLHPFMVTSEYVDLLQYTYGRGFQSRHRSKCLGLNLYLGKRLSNIASKSATTPKEEVKLSQYYRQNYQDLPRPFLERTANQMRTNAISFAGKLDTTFYFLKPHDRASPCQMVLITCGSKSSTTSNRRVIGFANSPHADTGDILDDSHVKEAKRRLQYVKGLSEQGRVSVSQSQIKYLEEFMERFPLSVPTTCAYQWVRRKYAQQEDGYYAYFVLHSMDWAVRIVDGVGHLFYAANFVHVTSICLVSINGKVFFINPEGNYNLFAWGDCSTKVDKVVYQPSVSTMSKDSSFS
jgi:hypothetical protein